MKSNYLITFILLISNNLYAFDLSIKITHPTTKINNVGCALFHEDIKDFFPMKFDGAKLTNAVLDDDILVCKFNDLISGRYAVSVFNDLNENNKLDTNFFGAPTENWGVSKNIRHSMSAPDFEESFIEIKNSDEEIEVTLGK